VLFDDPGDPFLALSGEHVPRRGAGRNGHGPSSDGFRMVSDAQ